MFHPYLSLPSQPSPRANLPRTSHRFLVPLLPKEKLVVFFNYIVHHHPEAKTQLWVQQNYSPILLYLYVHMPAFEWNSHHIHKDNQCSCILHHSTILFDLDNSDREIWYIFLQLGQNKSHFQSHRNHNFNCIRFCRKLCLHQPWHRSFPGLHLIHPPLADSHR